MNSLEGKRILLGITGGIAAYKTPNLVRLLVKAGAEVQVVLTESAQKFVSPLALEVVSGRAVGTSLWDTLPNNDGNEIAHTESGRHADAILVAPATAHFLARTVTGMAGDLLDNILLASRCPVLLAPSMNEWMYENQIVQGHLQTLGEMERFSIIEPEAGHLACNVVGKGRLPELESIVARLGSLFSERTLSGEHLIITAGPTREYLDPARFLSNPSTGKMGFALARAALARGAEVTLIHGPVELSSPTGAKSIAVNSAEEMMSAVSASLPDASALIMAAAVADWSPKHQNPEKEEKVGETRTIEMIRTPDILMGTKGIGSCVRVGFAAQTHNLRDNAVRKLERKGLDFIVANPIGSAHAGFGAETNEGMIITKGGKETVVSSCSKTSFAETILDELEVHLKRGA